MKYKRQSFLFIATTVGLASSISLVGGLGLQAISQRILPLVPLLIAIPSLNTLVGDYTAAIAAHAGDPAERKGTKKLVVMAIIKTAWFNILAIVALSLLLAWRRGYIFENSFMIRFALFVPAALIGVTFCMFMIIVWLDRLMEHRRMNADDILIPIVTSISDVLMLGFITLAVLTIF
jgi:cation transporter-like permease